MVKNVRFGFSTTKKPAAGKADPQQLKDAMVYEVAPRQLNAVATVKPVSFFQYRDCVPILEKALYNVGKGLAFNLDG